MQESGGIKKQKCRDWNEIVTRHAQPREEFRVGYKEAQQVELQHQTLPIEKRKQREIDQQGIDFPPQKGEGSGQNASGRQGSPKEQIGLVVMKNAKNFASGELRVRCVEERVHGRGCYINRGRGASSSPSASPCRLRLRSHGETLGPPRYTRHRAVASLDPATQKAVRFRSSVPESDGQKLCGDR